MKIMKKIYIYLAIVSAFILNNSCDEALDLTPLNSYSDIQVWSDPGLVEVFVNQIYTITVKTYKDNGLGWGMQTDELYGNHNWMSERTFNRGQATPDNGGSSLNMWSSFYGGIRFCNIFFQNINKVDTIVNAAKVNRMKGEVYFLRALSNYELLIRFGGVPLITNVFDINNLTFNETRATFDQTKDFILSDIANAVKYLPSSYTSSSNGRATIGAALALKSRLLLYVASPKFNPTNDQAKWTAAKNAALDVMNLGSYSLYGNASTYNNIFLSYFNSEVIFACVFPNNLRIDRYNTFTHNANPNGYGGQTAYNPLGQLVDDFQMADGTAFSWSNPVHASDPYSNREPRFYATILANNQMFKGRLTEFWDGGLESQSSTMAPNNASKTGYGMRKMVNESWNTLVLNHTDCQWVVFRLAEIYLNYAEACDALGQSGEALTYLNKIRFRAGLPNETSTNLTDKIRHERRIELCFEGQRFFDIRRWGIAEIGSQNALGINIKKSGTTFTYKIITTESRIWDPKLYYMPIPRSEIQNNPNIAQNTGYQ
jgi:starch-binding outer membrane protein, SusD/RagB family